MSRRLTVVEEVFVIEGRGLVFRPGLRPQSDDVLRIGDMLLLKRPDGSALTTPIRGIEFTPPHPSGELHVLLVGLTGKELPVGTAVWSVDIRP